MDSEKEGERERKSDTRTRIFWQKRKARGYSGPCIIRGMHDSIMSRYLPHNV